MYRNNYLVKKPNGIYKHTNAIYKSDTTVSDFIVSKDHIYKQFNELDIDARNTKINFNIGARLPSLSVRIKYA
jgi:hypothetical protein